MDREHLRSLLADVSQLPWSAGRPDATSYFADTLAPFKAVYGSDSDPASERHHVTGETLPPELATALGENCLTNAVLIVEAVNALPELLDRLDRLEKLCKILRCMMAELPPGCDDGGKFVDSEFAELLPEWHAPQWL